MHQVCVITLDLDDTLWPITPVIRRAESVLWEWLAANYPAVTENFSSADALAVRRQVIEEFPDRSHDLRFLRKTVLARMALSSGYDEALVEPAFAVFDAARNAVEIFPDVVPALQQLVGDFRLIAVTNGNANLKTIGIRHLFHDVVTAVDAGAAKPERPIFDEAVRRAGVPAAQVLHVGDHPEFDVSGASRAGMRTAWINRNAETWPEHLQPPDAEVSNIGELYSLLETARTGNQA